MVKLEIIATFAVCLFFNVFLNSFDVYSDIILAFDVLTFNLGESLILSGCKVCHGKEDSDVYSVKNRSCQQCLTRNRDFECGEIYAILEKLSKLEQTKTCDKAMFGVSWNLTSNSYRWNNKKCDN